MNFDVLYSIAIDLINKKRANNGNFSPNDFVCVLMTESNNIFTGVTVRNIENGKLISSCAECETIKIMMSSNETKIKALVNVNVYSLLPSIPCDKCQKLMLEINEQNSECLIMKPDNSFCALKDITINTNTSNSTDDWDMGWDDNDNTNDTSTMNTNINLDAFNPMANNSINQDNPMPNNPVTPNRFGNASVYTSRYMDNPMPNNPVNPNMMGNSSMYNSRYMNPMPNNPINPNMMGNSSMYNSRYMNPMPNSPVNPSAINMGNSSTFQAISVEFNPLSYQSANSQTNNVSSTLKTASVSQTKRSANSSSSSIFKQRLQSIMANDISPETPTDTNPTTNDDTNKLHNTSNNKLSKKELKAIAKEKKKQAKKNCKILEAMEKNSK